jgi:(1->4)-alpha-D-glucan 1-alpha-D-glucosylmutase
VYRTYVAEDGVVDERDRKYILQAVAAAKRRNPAESETIYDFIADILLQKFAAYVAEPERPAQLAFVIKLQQVLGPVMAKGLEDTVFYVYNRLLSLNEVGGDPQRVGVSPQQFHETNALRARVWPRTLLATATHDTKRGEDVRTRIDALSELPKEWSSALTSWTRRTEPLLRQVDGRAAPDRNERMLFFQTLIGAWPDPPAGTKQRGLPPQEELEQLSQRLQQYLVKAAKEAKVNTSWIQENQPWEEALRSFVRDLLALPARHAFWKSFLRLQERCAQIGMHDSLGQLVLKIASPGVPDLFQGCELWDRSLVDPDNRRPVDFELRRKLFRELIEDERSRPELARALYQGWEDGRIKLFVLQAGLRARRERPELFGAGSYQPLEPSGPRANHLVAFARVAHGGATAVAVVPRLVAGLLDGARLVPDRFAGTVIPATGSFVDVLTGEEREGPLRADQLFSTLPVALLVRD